MKKDIGTDYRVGRDNIKILGLDVHNPVFAVSAALIVLFVLYALIFHETSGETFNSIRKTLTSKGDWVFMISVNFMLLACIYFAFSPMGRIRLGGKNAKPKFSYFSWISLLFAAGVGIGLMFYGVLEPLYYLKYPPLGIEADSIQAAEIAVSATIFHWGLSAWAVYAIVGLSLALFSYNYGLPLTVRSAFYPLLKEKIWGWPGHLIDTLAAFATIFGLATSLGLGATQANGGLQYLFDIPMNNAVQIIIILCITILAIISVVLGVEKGVKRLSEANMILAMLLLLFVIVLGPTLEIVQNMFVNTYQYIKNIVPLSNWIDREDTGFYHGWTTFYWAWWIAWSPFVGMFIARVSKGRTVREFLLAVLILPTLFGIVWFTAFGGSAITDYVQTGSEGVMQTINDWTPELSLFKFLETLPFTKITSFIGIILVIVFFVTSSDSGSLVIDSITAGGKIDPPVPQRVFWATFEGIVAIVLLLGGGLGALQAASIATGFPFAIVLTVMTVCTYMGLKELSNLKKIENSKK